MKMCAEHWQKLRAAIEVRGLSHLVARSGAEAVQNTVLELEGREAEAYFDPLMAVHNMIWSACLSALGLGLMMVDEQGNHLCPLCTILPDYPPIPEGHRYKSKESYFIDGPADAVLELARAKGLVPAGPPDPDARGLR